MSAYLDGDAAAMRALVQRFTPRLYGFFRRHASVSADDCVQQTFLNLHKSRARYDRSRSFKAWLFKIAANVRIDAWRASGGKSEELDDEAVSADPTVELAIDRERMKVVIERVLQTLPEPQRAVVHLHFYEGLSFAEIAAVLGSNENAIKQRAFRAYTALRAQLPEPT